jgi:uncharacterized protein YdhG (YjbR/CyaY superfamily)
MAETIDAYIAECPPEQQQILQQVRKTIQSAAPEATEAMSYGMPTFKLAGNLVHFAAWKTHLGFYPTPSALQQFSKEISGYTSSKGAVQFPFDQPMPLDLITKMTRFRVQENLAKQQAKKKK